MTKRLANNAPGMTSDSANSMSDLRGATQLVVDAIVGVTDLVEHLQWTLLSFGGLLGSSEAENLPFPLGVAHSNVRAVTKMIGGALDVALERFASTLGEEESSPAREAVVAALNGVLGDYLAATDNPLAIDMALRRDGEPVDFQDPAIADAIRRANGRVLLLAHGSCANDIQWRQNGHDHGAALAEELGYFPLYLHYNSGLHISENGRKLSDLLDRFFAKVPYITELSVIGHSMGGLVTRSAIRQAEGSRHDWIDRFRTLVFMGTPHHGAPLERAGNWIDNILKISPYSAPFARLGQIRSAGITDLRYGNLLEQDWRGRDRFDPAPDQRQPVPLPDDIECYAVAATTGNGTNELVDQFIGDGIVPLDSALGRHDDPDLELAFPQSHQLVLRNTGHLDLLGDPRVYERLKQWLHHGE
mgnify:CR=1 FL=1